MVTPSDRQSRTTEKMGRSSETGSSAPPPPDVMERNADTLLLVLSPDIIDILRIEFSSDIRRDKRRELPAFSAAPPERYRAHLALDEVRRLFKQDLRATQGRATLVLDRDGGLTLHQQYNGISQRNTSLIISLLRKRIGVPLETATEVWSAIVQLLHANSLSFSGMRMQPRVENNEVIETLIQSQHE